MKLSRTSASKCMILAVKVHNYICHTNEEWKKAPIAWKLWPYDFVKEDKAMPWLGAVLPAFMCYYLDMKGVSGEELTAAMQTFSTVVTLRFADTEDEQNKLLSMMREFALYFEKAHKTGERALGIISLRDFLEKKRGAGEEKIFACILLYAYTLGAYWAMNIIDSDRAVSSAKQIALCLKCDQMTSMCKDAFDDFADNIELVDDEDETDLDEEDEEDDFFEDNSKFDDTDPEDDEDIVGARAIYSIYDQDPELHKQTLLLKDADVGLKLTNDLWRYIMMYRLDGDDEKFNSLKSDRELIYVAVVIYVTLYFISETFFNGAQKKAISVLRRGFAYNFCSHEPGFFYVTEVQFLKFLVDRAVDGNDDLDIPPFMKYVEQNVDLSIKDPIQGMTQTVCAAYKYAFSAAAIWLAHIPSSENSEEDENCEEWFSRIVRARFDADTEECSPKEQFEKFFDFISVSELARITVEFFKHAQA